ncbi:hypothetical protein [Streptomyces sp. NBC_01635]|uniref:hypothetical protein n=1 Tax=Streptomyces TaxID=1883 RepID=UPI00386D72D4
MIVSLVYQGTRKPPSIPAVLLRRDTSKDAGLLVLRHENAALRRQLDGSIRYEPADRLWFAALSGRIPRRCRREVFPATPPPRPVDTAGSSPPRGTAPHADTPDGRPPERRSGRSSCEWPRGTPGGASMHPGGAGRLGHSIAASTVWKIFHAAGVEPAPRRSGPTWREFLTARAEDIIATDFFHPDTVLGRRPYAPAFGEHDTGRLHITGITTHPT